MSDAPMPAERLLDGGLVLRGAGPDDIDAIESLQHRVFGPLELQGVRTFLRGPSADLSGWAVVCDPDRPDGEHVVSSCALARFPLVVEGHDLPAAQIEYVATDDGYRRRGLVRALIDWHHERSTARGDLVQLIMGIPYVYRRFGYGWGISTPRSFAIADSMLAPDPTVVLRRAREDDLDALVELDAQRSHLGVRARRDREHFARLRWHADEAVPDGTGPDLLQVADRDGVVVGWSVVSARTDEQYLYLAGAVADDDGVADVLLDDARTRARTGGLRTQIYEVPDTVYGRRLEAVGHPEPYTYGYYVRIADPVVVLRHLQPLLTARLSTSSLVEAAGATTLSTYVDGIAITYESGEVTSIERTEAIEDPIDGTGCGVPPDWFPALVLGRFGAATLEAHVDDVYFGSQVELYDILFPRLDADIYLDF